MQPDPSLAKTDASSAGDGNAFPRTRWTIVARLREADAEAARAALAQLCEAYWRPIYTFLRRSGHDPTDAEDWTQGFFEYLIAHEKLMEACAERGRMRTFLIGRLKGYLATGLRKANRLKRGGGALVLSLDADEAERRIAAEFVEQTTPDVAYDRAWLITVLERTLKCLRTECEAEGKGPLFAELQPFLTEAPDETYEAVASRLGMTGNATRVAVHRLRTRYREALVREVAETVAGPEELGIELRELMGFAR